MFARTDLAAVTDSSKLVSERADRRAGGRRQLQGEGGREGHRMKLTNGHGVEGSEQAGRH